MPVKLCPACSNPVTAHLAACHTCGAPLRGNAFRKGFKQLMLETLIALAVLGAVGVGIWHYGLRPVLG